MYDRLHKTAFLFLSLMVVLIPGLSSQEEARKIPLDMYLIIDGSTALREGRDEAVQWLCDYAVDALLQEGDNLCLWIAAGEAKLLYSGRIAGAQGKERVKGLIRSLSLQGEAADYAGALRQATAREAERTEDRIPYTLLVCGSAGLSPVMGNGEAAKFLRYSRVREFPGWRTLVVALDVNSRIQSAASAYMR